MNGEEQRDRVIRYIFCSIIRNVTDLYPIFPAARDVDDIETDAHPRNHFAVPEPCCDRFADRNLMGHNSDRISNLVYNLALHSDRHQLEPGTRQQLLFDRQIGMRRIEIIDSLVFHNLSEAHSPLERFLPRSFDSFRHQYGNHPPPTTNTSPVTKNQGERILTLHVFWTCHAGSRRSASLPRP